MRRSAVSCTPALLATALLAACGGSGSYSGMMNSSPPSGQVHGPTPVPAPPQPCTGTQTADCVVADAATSEMRDGRDSAFALIVRNQGTSLRLTTGTFAFANGAQVESGALLVNEVATLRANTHVHVDGFFVAQGTIVGNVDNDGYMRFFGTINGNLDNAGHLVAESSYQFMPAQVPQHITGNFVQSSTGELEVAIGYPGGMLDVDGTATLAGTLALVRYSDGFGQCPIPATPLTHHIVHADGGVTGTFASWSSPFLMITGDVRYTPNDVFFDAASITAATVMAGSDALTLESAKRFDAALASPASQDRLLRSAALVQRIPDLAQARQTFDSLSGHGFVQAMEAQMQHALRAAPVIATHLDDAHATGAWASQPAPLASAGFMRDSTFGYDTRLANGWLAGSSVAWSEGTLALERGGGQLHGRSPQANLYMQRSGTRGYTLGVVGFGRQRMELDRTIDLGYAAHPAHAQRDVDTAIGYVESGRAFALGGGRITPFVAAHYSRARAGAFTEQGVTGFELIGDASTHERLGADFGMRYGREWNWLSGRWLQLEAGVRQQHLFQANDFATARFVGAPDLEFDLHGTPIDRNAQTWSLGLLGGRDARWAWSLRWESYTEDNAVSLAFGRAF